ncbi:hypothetical protein A3I80_02345 [Candidatus Gottesmanbacteria bacterium RIFCSPLOWO2_02_FULL_40_10]|nr:MAG: hypothetical protein A3I80_02345 [Candidatus Gottesmanbacteria bacterium RIFCSPLOWO2_02_FULL_40_10]
MVRLSIAIAVYNEEQNIKRCLDSCAGLADEIVAVDGSSTDNSVAILKSYNARIFIRKNPVNFHINKNLAIDSCRGRWILQLDADEVVSPGLKKEILQVIALPLTHNRQPANGYWIPRKNFILGRFLEKGGQYPDYTLRLYRKGFGRLPGKSVHEQAQVKGPVGNLINPILHYPYPDFSHYLDHFNRYTSIMAIDLKKENIKLTPVVFADYILVKPLTWFFRTYFLNKGFYDGFAGFAFSLFSSLRFTVAYIKYRELFKN